MSSEPIGDLHVEREEGSIKLRIVREDGEEEPLFIPPERAVQMAIWLQQAASDAKKYQQQQQP